MLCSMVVSASLVVFGQFGFPLTPDSNPSAFPYDDGSWKVALQEKETILRDMMLTNHSIEGLYPSQLTLIDGKANHTTLGHADVSHSIHWTSLLLVGEIYRWKVTGDPAAFERVKEVFNAVDRCQRINQVPGVLSRGYIYGHGPSYEERRGHGRTQDRWWQGTGEFERFRWRGNPSHHNHSAFFRAMGIAWAMIDDPEIRAKVKENVDQVIQRTYIDNDMAVVDHDGVTTAHLFGGRRDQDAPSMRLLFVTTALKIGSEVTQRPQVTRMYEDLVAQLNYRAWADRPAAELAATINKYHDDADQCFHHLHTMMLLEKDEVLLRFYRNFAEALWIIHGDEKQPSYNALYHMITGNDPKAEDIRWWLNHYPTNKVFQPRQNSFRVARGEKFDGPLPLSERPFDNEYDFKEDPYRLDGWGSRFVTNVAVSPKDPMIVFACDDDGFLYRSNDGGKTWMDSYQGLAGAKAKAVLPSPMTLEVVLAATDRGIMRSRDFGFSWTHVLGDGATALAHDPAREGVAYALTADGFYESVAFDNISWGFTWRKSGGDGPPWPVTRYFLNATPGGVQFLAQDERNTVWGSKPGQTEWTLLNRPFDGRYAFTSVSGSGNSLLAVTPGVPAVAYSANGGKVWEPRGGQIYWWTAPGEGFGDEPIVAAALDPKDPNVFYVAVASGFWASRDAGRTWERAENGMDIPVVGQIIPCPQTGRVYAGSRGGLVWTDDQGRTWNRGNLVLQFQGNTRMATGPADFMVSYWLARHIGAVTEEQAVAPWAE